MYKIGVRPGERFLDPPPPPPPPLPSPSLFVSCVWAGAGPLPFQRGGRVVEISPKAGGCSAVSTWVETVSGEEAASRVQLAQRRLEAGRL